MKACGLFVFLAPEETMKRAVTIMSRNVCCFHTCTYIIVPPLSRLNLRSPQMFGSHPYLHTLIMLTSLIALTACGDPQEQQPKGEPAQSPSLSLGKADHALTLKPQGVLGFGPDRAVTSDFVGAGQLHTYELSAGANAELALEVTQRGSSRGLDTVLYVFGPRDEDGQYPPSIIAYDDDRGWGALSRIRPLTLTEQGTYLVIVGTFSGRQRGRYRLEATCLGASCEPMTPTTPSRCVFGEQYRGLFGAHPDVIPTAQRKILTSSALTELERQQLIAAVATTYDEVTTLAQALDVVDNQEVNQTQLWDASNRRAYIAYEFGAGDNSYGAILNAADTTIVAKIQDGELNQCAIAAGPERQACGQDADCAVGLRCEGISNGQGACLNTQALEGPKVGHSCQDTAACDPSAGLICAGESTGFGNCSPAWMKRTFEATQTPTPLLNATTTLTINTFGLGTVHTDQWLDLELSHPDPTQLTVTLTNPSGTSVILHDRVAGALSWSKVPMFGFPGDESANGIWSLTLVDSSAAPSGSVASFGLTLMSRWD